MMNNEETKLYNYLTTNKINAIRIDHEYGWVIITTDNNEQITIGGKEDNIYVEYEEIK